MFTNTKENDFLFRANNKEACPYGNAQNKFIERGLYDQLDGENHFKPTIEKLNKLKLDPMMFFKKGDTKSEKWNTVAIRHLHDYLKAY